MKDFIKLPQVFRFSDETYSEAQNHNVRLNKHYVTVAKTFNDPSGVMMIVKWNSGSTISRARNSLKGELQRENKFISYERAFKMLDNDMYIAGIGQAVLELLSFKVGSGNHQRGISLLQKFSDIFGNMRLVPLKMTSHLTSHNF